MKRIPACIAIALILLVAPVVASCEVNLPPVSLGLGTSRLDHTIHVGETDTLIVMVVGADETGFSFISKPNAEYKYVSANRAIATVDSNGVVTGVSPGIVTIHVSGSCTVTVDDEEKTYNLYNKIDITVLSPAKIADMRIVQTQTAAPSITFPEDYTGSKDGKWLVKDPSIASIAEDGKITGLKPGTTTAYFDQNGAVVSFNVTVESIFQLKPASINAVAGVPQVVRAEYNALYRGDKRGVWASSDPSLVSVDAGGTVKALQNAAGSAVLTYTAAGVSHAVPVTVRPLFTIWMDPAEVYADTGAQLAVRFDPACTGSKDGAWAVADEAIAAVGQDGVVRGVSAGTTAVTFTHAATGLKATREITVLSPIPTATPTETPSPSPSPSPTPKPTTKPSTNPIKLKSTNVTVISGIARLEASGGAGGPYTFSLSSTEAAKFSSHGLTLDPDGFVHGMPSTGSFTAKVTVKDVKGNKATISVKFKLLDH